MADRVTNGPVESPASIREAVCVNTRKIYDSCRDKDCVDDLRVYPTESSQSAIDNALNIRKANLFVACPAWLIYDIIFHSYAGILNEVITITSILISIWRFGWKNLGDPNSGFSQKRIDSDSE